MPVSAHEVASYFLSKRAVDAGDEISNLKIQKLVYYAQGFHLALTGRPLFEETIEAWRYGPVVPGLYHAYKSCGDGNLPAVDPEQYQGLTDEQIELLDEVYTAYGQFSAWKLRDLTHSEAPWRDADELGETVITHDALRSFFSTRITP